MKDYRKIGLMQSAGVRFKCVAANCGNVVFWTVGDLMFKGTPQCSECDEPMDLVSQNVYRSELLNVAYVQKRKKSARYKMPKMPTALEFACGNIWRPYPDIQVQQTNGAFCVMKLSEYGDKRIRVKTVKEMRKAVSMFRNLSNQVWPNSDMTRVDFLQLIKEH